MSVLLRAEALVVRHNYRPLVGPVDLLLSEGERVVIFGPAASGKTILAEALAGRRHAYSGTLEFSPGAEVSVVTAESAHRLANSETPVGLEAHLEGPFRLGHLAGRQYSTLSTGERHKLLIAQVLSSDASLVILDDPFRGLDVESQDRLRRYLAAERPGDAHRCIVLLTGRERDVPGAGWRQVALPPRQAIAAPDDRHGGAPRPTTARGRAVLLALNHVNVSYGATPVLRDISWTVRRGETWTLAGPNGSGKTTLLSLITGDNPKAYGQDITLFGRRRGSGETVAEIKRHIGVVSGELHAHFPHRARAIDTVVSGFYDSFGLRAAAPGHRMEAARELLAFFGIPWAEDEVFSDLSSGTQRVVLIARALIKAPELLVADEPAQGLDHESTLRVLDGLDRLAAAGTATLLYVSHDPDYQLSAPGRRLELVPQPTGGSRAVVT